MRDDPIKAAVLTAQRETLRYAFNRLASDLEDLCELSDRDRQWKIDRAALCATHSRLFVETVCPPGGPSPEHVRAALEEQLDVLVQQVAEEGLPDSARLSVEMLVTFFRTVLRTERVFAEAAE